MTQAQEVARVSVRILEKEYVIACPHGERADLLDSAEYLNAKMREIRDQGKIMGLDRIAVMAALNLAHDLLQLKAREQDIDGSAGVRIRAMRERVESVLEKGRQLEL